MCFTVLTALLNTDSRDKRDNYVNTHRIKYVIVKKSSPTVDVVNVGKYQSRIAVNYWYRVKYVNTEICYDKSTENSLAFEELKIGDTISSNSIYDYRIAQDSMFKVLDEKASKVGGQKAIIGVLCIFIGIVSLLTIILSL